VRTIVAPHRAQRAIRVAFCQLIAVSHAFAFAYISAHECSHANSRGNGRRSARARGAAKAAAASKYGERRRREFLPPPAKFAGACRAKRGIARAFRA